MNTAKFEAGSGEAYGIKNRLIHFLFNPESMENGKYSHLWPMTRCAEMLTGNRVGDSLS